MKTSHKPLLARDSERLINLENAKHGLPSGLLKAISFGFFIAFTIFCLCAPLLHNVFDWLDENGHIISLFIFGAVTIWACFPLIRFCVRWTIRGVQLIIKGVRWIVRKRK